MNQKLGYGQTSTNSHDINIMTLKKLEVGLPLAMGRAQRQLALGDDMALVDAHEEARLWLRRRHEYEPFPVRQTKKRG